MLILDNCSTVGCQTTLLQIRKHVIQMDGSQKFNYSITQKFQSLIVSDTRFCLLLLAKAVT